MALFVVEPLRAMNVGGTVEPEVCEAEEADPPSCSAAASFSMSQSRAHNTDLTTDIRHVISKCSTLYMIPLHQLARAPRRGWGSPHTRTAICMVSVPKGARAHRAEMQPALMQRAWRPLKPAQQNGSGVLWRAAVCHGPHLPAAAAWPAVGTSHWKGGVSAMKGWSHDCGGCARRGRSEG